jgi:hypothetical protein
MLIRIAVFVMALLGLSGVATDARKPSRAAQVATIDSLVSVDGVVQIPASAFTDKSVRYVSVKNCQGSVSYMLSLSMRVEQPDNPTGHESQVYNVANDAKCTGAGFGYGGPYATKIFHPIDPRTVELGGAVDSGFQFSVTIFYQPAYAISYEAEPRYLLVIRPL